MNCQNEEVVESTKKPPARKPSWLGAIYESAYDSTTHGLPHIFKREHLMLRIFWIVCFFCSAGVCSYMIARSIIEYSKFETVTKTDSIFEIPTLFPTVSICNQNAFVTDQSFDYVKEIFRANNVTDLEAALVNASALGFIGLKYIVGVIMRDPVFSDQERKITGFNLSQMLLSCTYNNNLCTSKEFSWYYDSYYGNCFSFNSGKFLNGSLAPDKYSTKAGSINGLSFELFIPEPTNVYALSFVNGVHITVHNRSVRPIFFNGFNANVGTFTYVALNREFTSLLEHPYSECIREIQSYAKRSIYVKALLDANITYSQNDCFNVCLQDRIVRDCHCYILEFPYWDSSSSTPCRSLKELSCFGEIFNDFFNDDLNEACPDACPLECDSSKFLISSSILDFPSKVYANVLKTDWRIQARFNNRKNVSQDELKRNLLGITIFYDDLSYKRYSQLEKWLIIDLISSIGGTLGLFLGMSFLSFVELIDLIVQLLFKSYGKSKREKIYPSDSNE